MKTLLCCLHNTSTGHYSQPLIFETKEQAVTTFMNEIRADKSELANIKDTLSIYHVGHFDHKTGIPETLRFRRKKLLMHGKEVLLKTESQKRDEENLYGAFGAYHEKGE